MFSLGEQHILELLVNCFEANCKRILWFELNWISWLFDHLVVKNRALKAPLVALEPGYTWSFFSKIEVF